VANTLAYLNTATITVVKCFIVQAPGLADFVAVMSDINNLKDCSCLGDVIVVFVLI